MGEKISNRATPTNIKIFKTCGTYSNAVRDFFHYGYPTKLDSHMVYTTRFFDDDSNSYIYHREDGPALYSVNYVERYYFHGVRHRLDGPAITTLFSKKGKEEHWYIGDQEINELEYENWLSSNGMNVKALSLEDKFLILSRYAPHMLRFLYSE